MNRIDEIIEEALRADEPVIPKDQFCERVLSSLPPAKRRIESSAARRLSFAAAAFIGSLVTLLLGAPIEGLFVGYIEHSELISILLGASVVAGVFVIPLLWLMYTEGAG